MLEIVNRCEMVIGRKWKEESGKERFQITVNEQKIRNGNYSGLDRAGLSKTS